MDEMDRVILESAKAKLEEQRSALDAKLIEISRRLGVAPSPSPLTVAPAADGGIPDIPAQPPAKKVLSMSARKRISAAQKKRWQNYKKQTK